MIDLTTQFRGLVEGAKVAGHPIKRKPVRRQEVIVLCNNAISKAKDIVKSHYSSALHQF